MAIKPESLYLLSVDSDKVIFADNEAYKNLLISFSDELGSLAVMTAYCLTPTKLRVIVKIEADGKLEEILKASGAINKNFASFDEAAGQLILSTLIQNKISGFFKSKLNEKLSMKEIEESQLGDELAEAHLTPVNLKLCSSPADWTFSSFNAFTSDRPTKIPREFVLNLVGGIDAFKELHHLPKLS